MNCMKADVFKYPANRLFHEVKKDTMIKLRHKLRVELMWGTPVYGMKIILVVR